MFRCVTHSELGQYISAGSDSNTDNCAETKREEIYQWQCIQSCEDQSCCQVYMSFAGVTNEDLNML